MLPPLTGALVPRVVRRNAAAMRRTLAGLRRAARNREQRGACSALEAVLRSLRGPRRTAFLWAPEVRAWLRGAGEALALVEARLTDQALFDRIARGSHLATLLPSGRIDRRFRGRALSLGKRLLERTFLRLPPLVMFLTPAGRRFGPFPLDLEADGEEARAAGEVHVPFPTPYTWTLRPGATAELRGDEVRLSLPDGEPRGRPRETVDGSGIVVARRAAASRRGLRPGGAVRGLAGRLAASLELIRAAWPEAAAEVQVHTRVVVPLVERAVVSYSLPDRPGTSYINVEGKDRVDLADDLLHETAHHRLHSLEELGPLIRRRADAHYYSPWRRQVRPLHGILHATYTFTFRAQLFRRLLALPGRLPRARLERDVARECEMLGQSLVYLHDARERGLLTETGCLVLEALADAVDRLGRR